MANWTEEIIAGKHVDVFQPTGQAKPRFAMLFLHGYGLETLWQNEVYTHLFETLKVPCVSPHGQHSWWADRICAEFDRTITAERYLLDHVLPYFNQRWQLTAGAIGLFGISMGGQGALRLAF